MNVAEKKNTYFLFLQRSFHLQTDGCKIKKCVANTSYMWNERSNYIENLLTSLNRVNHSLSTHVKLKLCKQGTKKGIGLRIGRLETIKYECFWLGFHFSIT